MCKCIMSDYQVNQIVFNLKIKLYIEHNFRYTCSFKGKITGLLKNIGFVVFNDLY